MNSLFSLIDSYVPTVNAYVEEASQSLPSAQTITTNLNSLAHKISESLPDVHALAAPLRNHFFTEEPAVEKKPIPEHLKEENEQALVLVQAEVPEVIQPAQKDNIKKIETIMDNYYKLVKSVVSNIENEKVSLLMKNRKI